MMTIREYKQAESLEEAWQLNQKKANRVLGGMIWLKMENINVGTAIDLSGLGLDTIEETDVGFSIGAMVTLRQLETHPGLEAFTHGAVREALAALGYDPSIPEESILAFRLHYLRGDLIVALEQENAIAFCLWQKKSAESLRDRP